MLTSNDGITQYDRRVSPVEVLYASFPMFLYINASYGKPLLSPLLEYQDTPLYGLPYAARDLGDLKSANGTLLH